MRVRVKSLMVILFFFILLPSIGLAAESSAQSLARQGKIYFLSKDYNKAYDVLYKAFKEDPTDLSTSFYLGRAAFEIGNYEMAIMSFDRVLIMSPDSIRVKLELARCHMRLGAYETAKQYFYDVLASKPPQTVRDNVNLYLAAIASAEKQNFFSGSVSVGMSFDDNVRSAPGNFQYIYPGATGDVTLNLTAPPVKDHFFVTTASLDHIYKFEDSKFAWKTNGIVLKNAYSDTHDLDITYYGITTGPVFQADNYLLEVHGDFHDLTLGYDEYVQPIGTGGSATIVLGSNVLFNASAEIQRKKYSRTTDSVRDATNINITLGPSFIAGANRLSATCTKEYESAKADYWSYTASGVGIRYDRVLPHNFAFFIGFNLKRTNYNGIKTNEVTVRADQERDYAFGASKRLWQGKDKKQGATLQLTYTRTKTKSTMETYRYDKNVFSSVVSYVF